MERSTTNRNDTFEDYYIPDTLENELQKLAISNQNAQNSPLLRLPAEIRDEIYEYVLGSQQLEVRVNGDTFFSDHVIEIRAPLNRPLTEEDIYNDEGSVLQEKVPPCDKLTAKRRIVEDPMYKYIGSTYPQLAPAPCAKSPSPFGIQNRVQQMLATTQVCRQIHHDTALLPFRYIVFSSDYLKWLTAWIQTRIKLDKQRNAIAILKIRYDEVIFQSWSDFDQLSVYQPVMKMLATFPHLERLVLMDWKGWRNWNKDRSGMKDKVQERIRIASGLKDLVVEGFEDDD
ncbi:hypothetical protein CC86DRAFT_431421 [Ophiobolus disseminans]|uniref:Uncharacterized protein n=1 Tax=Ophiobolus disseminans TaxID=1469910 RepID=A0A6A7AFV7_9PLEO|nr:hypothetical protein CC86DRAFT_431421 [Ophiobolus disseminans]